MFIPDAAVGPVIAAIIAGLVVFMSTVLSKEQKTSEFRQQWIDELRKDVAQYISGTVEFAAMISHKRKGGGEHAFLDDNFSSINELQAIEQRIVLRLNSVKHASLLAKIKGFRSNIFSIYEQSLSNKAVEAALTDALISDCKDILKEEWERVKKGEPAFRIVKWVALAAACILASAILVASIIGGGDVSPNIGKGSAPSLEVKEHSPPAMATQSVHVTVNGAGVPAPQEIHSRSKLPAEQRKKKPAVDLNRNCSNKCSVAS